MYSIQGFVFCSTISHTYLPIDDFLTENFHYKGTLKEAEVEGLKDPSLAEILTYEDLVR